MKIAITGTHGSGKTTLIGDFLERFPDYLLEQEPYWALAQQGVAFATLVLPAIGILLLAGQQHNLAATALGVVLLGVAQGAEGDQVAFFVARFFPLGLYSRIFSVLMVCISASLGVGGILYGYTFDKTGNYDLVLYASSALFIFAGVCMLLLGRGKLHLQPIAGTVER